MVKRMNIGDYIPAELITSEEMLEAIRAKVKGMGYRVSDNYGTWNPFTDKEWALVLDGDGDLMWDTDPREIIITPADLGVFEDACDGCDGETKQGHPHAARMARYAEVAKTNPEPWTEFQFFPLDGTSKSWHDCHANPTWSVYNLYRRKPKPAPTIRIGDEEVPRGETEAPSSGQTYYRPTLTGDLFYWKCLWENDSWDKCRLNNGLVYLTAENAAKVGKALAKLLVAE